MAFANMKKKMKTKKQNEKMTVFDIVSCKNEVVVVNWHNF